MIAEHDNQSVSVSIIKYVADRVETERRLTDSERSALKELVFAHFSNIEKAIERDIVEVRRRLDELNHEHARNIERNREYLAAPLFFQYRDGVDLRLGTIERSLANQAGRAAAYASIIGIVFLIVQIALHYLK
jgi:hypothetical protein